ncbi:MAG: O-antigen ligase family protein [Candidatus Paceibacterota bacterium]
MQIKKISSAVAFTALFLIPFFPLIVDNSLFFPFITGKAFYFRMLVEVAFAAWLILAFIDAKYRPKITPLFLAISIFALVSLVANLLGVNPLRSFWSNFERMEGWITVLHLWMFFVTSTSLFGHGEEGRRHWKNWLLFSLGTALVAALYGLLQLGGVLAIHQGSTRLDASLGNSAYLAVYMLINAGMVVYLFLGEKVRWTWKIRRERLWIFWLSIVSAIIFLTFVYGASESSAFLPLLGVFIKAHFWSFLVGFIVFVLAVLYPYYILPLLFSFLIFETQTRGTILGLLGGIILALVLYALLAKKEARISRFISAGIVILIILVGLVFWFNRGSQFIKNSEVLNRLATISLSDVKTQARGYIWPMALKGTMERPIFGWGQENFNYIFNANYNPAMYNQEQWFDRAHNVFLDWFVATGFVGLIAYLALYIIFLRVIWQRKNNLSLAEKSLLTGLLAGYAIHNFFVFDNLASYALFFAALGLVNTFSSEWAVRPFGIKPTRNDAVEYIVLPIVIVVLIAGIYFFNIRVIRANTQLIYAMQSCSGSNSPDAALFQSALNVNSYAANQEIREQILFCAGRTISAAQVPGPTKQAFFALADTALKDQISVTPKDTRIYTLGGSYLNSVGKFTESLPILLSAHELSPAKQTISLELATTYLNNGKLAEALSLLKGAYEAAPDFYQVKAAYLTVLVLAGQENVARMIAAPDTTIFETAQMAQAYVSLKEYDKAIAVYKKLAAATPSDINLPLRLAQIQYTAGYISQSVATLRGMEKDRPDLKDQIEAIIKSIK